MSTQKVSYETKLKENRCCIDGSVPYVGYYLAHERDLAGTCLLISWTRTGRLHQIIGRKRINYFYILIHDRSVTNIWEHFAILPREKINEINDALNKEFPTRNKKVPLDKQKNPLPLVIDSVVTRGNEKTAVLLLKRNSPKNPVIAMQKELIEYYCKQQNWKLEVIDPERDSRFNSTYINNLRLLHSPLAFSKEDIPPIAFNRFKELYQQASLSIYKIGELVDKELHLLSGNGLSAFFHLARDGEISVDLTKPLDILLPRNHIIRPLYSFSPPSKSLSDEDDVSFYFHPFNTEPTELSPHVLEIDQCYHLISRQVPLDPEKKELLEALYQLNQYLPDKGDLLRILSLVPYAVYVIPVGPSMIAPYSIPRDLFIRAKEAGILRFSNAPLSLPQVSKKTNSMLKRQAFWETVFKEHEAKTSMVWDEKERNRQIQKIHEKTGKSIKTILNCFLTYARSGFNRESLLGSASNSGQTKESHLNKVTLGGQKPKGDHAMGKVLTEEDHGYFLKVYQKYYATPRQPTLHNTYLHLLNRYYRCPDQPDHILPPDQCPSQTQFEYWVRNLDDLTKSKVKLSRLGFRGAPLKGRASFGYLSFGLPHFGDRWMFDATRIPVVLVDRHNRTKLIGSAHLFALIDVATREIVGIHLALGEGEPKVAIRMTILNALCNKVEFCKSHGVLIEPEQWFVENMLPNMIICDNNTTVSEDFDSFVSELGISLEHPPTYRGDLKGIVESFFGPQKKKLKFDVSGYIDTEYKENTGVDYNLTASLTMEDLWEIIIHLVIWHNNYHVNTFRGRGDWIYENIAPTPNAMTRFSLEHNSGLVRFMDSRQVNTSMLPWNDGTLTDEGLHVKKLTYVPLNAATKAACILARNKWKKDNPSLETYSLKVHYDPALNLFAFVNFPGQKSSAVFILCKADQEAMGSLSWYETELLIDIQEKAIATQKNLSVPESAKLANNIKEIVEKSKRLQRIDKQKFGEKMNTEIAKNRLEEQKIEASNNLKNTYSDDLLNVFLHNP